MITDAKIRLLLLTVLDGCPESGRDLTGLRAEVQTIHLRAKAGDVQWAAVVQQMEREGFIARGGVDRWSGEELYTITEEGRALLHG